MKNFIKYFLISLVLLFNSRLFSQEKAAKDDSTWFVISKEDLRGGTHNTKHFEIFGKYIDGYNQDILKAVDLVQSKAMDGGGYFIGITADPPESPVGYDLELLGKPLLKHTRKTSYCSGSTYAAFIESLNFILKGKGKKLSADRYEALRMQEIYGGRREDGIKFWGKWNDDGWGDHYALVQYSKMGKKIDPINARPGDFMNISWKSGNGHSVIFLGWYIDENNEKNIVYWASQKGTNGYGNDVVPIRKIKNIVTVRLTNPENLFNFDVTTTVKRNISGDKIKW